MKHNNSGNAAYIPREDYYQDGGYLGYGGYRDANGCRNLFFVIMGVILMTVLGGLLAIVLK